MNSAIPQKPTAGAASLLKPGCVEEWDPEDEGFW